MGPSEWVPPEDGGRNVRVSNKMKALNNIDPIL
jgi:hypothetical protein